MDYTNKVVKISAYVLLALVIITLTLQLMNIYIRGELDLKALLFLYPLPFTFFYFRNHSGKSLGSNLLLLAFNIFTVVGFIFKYYVYPLTH